MYILSFVVIQRLSESQEGYAPAILVGLMYGAVIFAICGETGSGTYPGELVD